jgi:hypothetical protein
MNRSLKRTKEIFELIEEELNLFEMKICGVKLWQYIRFLVFSAIQRSKPFKKSHAWHYWLKKIFVLLKYSFIKNALIGKKKDILVFNHPRRKIIDGQNWAIYTDLLIKSGGLGSNYQVIELAYEERKPAMIKETKMLDFAQTMAFLYRIFIKVRFNDRELTQLKQLENRIKNDFGINLNIVSLGKKKIREIRSYFWILNKLLDVYQPKLIIEVVHYDRILMALNDLCKKRGIPTIEFQHGRIGPYHLAYDFPSNIRIDVFPDYFFSFGKYWEVNTRLPILKEKIITGGFPYLESEFKKYEKMSKSDQILFISSDTLGGSIGKALSKFAHKFAEITDNKIIYKLHPKEQSGWKKEYPWLRNEKIRVIDHDNIPLYKLLAESKVLIGVGSTVLSEGLIFGIRTFIVNLPGYKIYTSLINNGIFTLITNPEDLLEELEKTEVEVKSIDRNFIFKINSLKNQKEAIGDILKNI